MKTELFSVAIVSCLFMVQRAGSAEPRNVELRPQLAGYVEERRAEFDQIPADRVEKLREVAEYVASCRKAGKPARLTFICTHNSRRSQMAQLWAAVAAASSGIDGVETFSGGTERTAFNPRAVAALRRAGFEIAETTASPNPRYTVALADDLEPLLCFSKVYNESPNPAREFCAVMTCSQADKSCPFVAGASRRIAIPFEDPKVADDTPAESAAYDERCAQIARELLFAFSLVDQPVK
jgi:arsenate reductase